MIGRSTPSPARPGKHTPDPVCNYCLDGDTCVKRAPRVDGCRDLRPLPVRAPGVRPDPGREAIGREASRLG